MSVEVYNVNVDRKSKVSLFTDGKYFCCRSKLERDKDRDISEKIALGVPSGAPTQESLFDQRLFNQTQVSKWAWGNRDDTLVSVWSLTQARRRRVIVVSLCVCVTS